MIKKLPIDVSNFKTMIEDDYVYVDKTRHIYELITQGRFYFLSRPRRFGKSLLVSTLKEIFLGNKELFAHVWIGSSSYKWHKYPVIHLDFSSISHNDAENLRSNLMLRLKSIAADYGVTLQEAADPESLFYDLVKKLAQIAKVVVLIDEYDYPILKHITDVALAGQMQEVLRGFYTTIKGLDEYLKFVLLTGVTKFSRTSIFSGLNNLNDISLDLEGATLLGYTEHEIERYFGPHITYFADKQKTSVNVIMKNMKVWYNGYRFSGNSVVEKIYNPFSVLYYLHKQQRKNYWFASGTPTFLVSLLKQKYYHKAIESFDKVTMTEDSLISFDMSGDIPLNTLLFQTGYLTIKSYDPRHAMYTLACPNQEVRISLTTYLLSIATDSEKQQVDSLVFGLKKALEHNDVKHFCVQLQSLFASIPYHIMLSNEAYWHSLFHLLATLLNVEVQSEVATSRGRVDLVVTIKKRIFIFEFKFNTSGAQALEQIEDRRYYEKYLTKNKSITLVGVSFNSVDKKLVLDSVSKALEHQ